MPDIVHVACKIASGIALGGADGVKVAGTAFEPQPGIPGPPRPGGFAITSNVPRDVWEQWLHDNERSVMVTRQLIFADPDLATLKAKAISLRNVP